MDDTLPNASWWVLLSMVARQMYKLQIEWQSGKRTKNERRKNSQAAASRQKGGWVGLEVAHR